MNRALPLEALLKAERDRLMLIEICIDRSVNSAAGGLIERFEEPAAFSCQAILCRAHARGAAAARSIPC